MSKLLKRLKGKAKKSTVASVDGPCCDPSYGKDEKILCDKGKSGYTYKTISLCKDISFLNLKANKFNGDERYTISDISLECKIDNETGELKDKYIDSYFKIGDGRNYVAFNTYANVENVQKQLASIDEIIKRLVKHKEIILNAINNENIKEISEA
jgi:hypothetical protein